MGYRPMSDEAVEIKAEALANQKLKEMIEKISAVETMYVEPGDIVVIRVDDEADQETMQNISQIASKIFRENKGMLIPDHMDLKIIKKSQSGQLYESQESELLKLKQRIWSLEETLNSLVETFKANKT